jgi:hypothetical protein
MWRFRGDAKEEVAHTPNTRLCSSESAACGRPTRSPSSTQREQPLGSIADLREVVSEMDLELEGREIRRNPARELRSRRFDERGGEGCRGVDLRSDDRAQFRAAVDPLEERLALLATAFSLVGVSLLVLAVVLALAGRSQPQPAVALLEPRERLRALCERGR